MSEMKRNKLAAGFTLVEVLVVVVIIGIIASIVVLSLIKARQAADDIAMVAVCKEFQRGEVQFYASHSRFGTSGELLAENLINARNENPGGTPAIRGHYFVTNAADQNGYRIHAYTGNPAKRQYLLGYRDDGGIIIYDPNLGYVLFEDIYGK